MATFSSHRDIDSGKWSETKYAMLHVWSLNTNHIAILQRDVDNWLRRLELQEYKDLFSKEGYSTADDIGNLKGLQERELREMGIHKRGETR